MVYCTFICSVLSVDNIIVYVIMALLPLRLNRSPCSHWIILFIIEHWNWWVLFVEYPMNSNFLAHYCTLVRPIVALLFETLIQPMPVIKLSGFNDEILKFIEIWPQYFHPSSYDYILVFLVEKFFDDSLILIGSGFDRI